MELSIGTRTLNFAVGNQLGLLQSEEPGSVVSCGGHQGVGLLVHTPAWALLLRWVGDRCWECRGSMQVEPANLLGTASRLCVE